VYAFLATIVQYYNTPYKSWTQKPRKTFMEFCLAAPSAGRNSGREVSLSAANGCSLQLPHAAPVASNASCTVRMESATNPLSVLSLNINQPQRRAQKTVVMLGHILTYFCATPANIHNSALSFTGLPFHQPFLPGPGPNNKFKIKNKHSKMLKYQFFLYLHVF